MSQVVQYLQPCETFALFETDKKLTKLSKHINKKALLAQSSKCRVCQDFYGKPHTDFCCTTCWAKVPKECIAERQKYRKPIVLTERQQEFLCAKQALEERREKFNSLAMSDSEFSQHVVICETAIITDILNGVNSEKDLCIRIHTYSCSRKHKLLRINQQKVLFDAIYKVLTDHKIIKECMDNIWSTLIMYVTDPHNVQQGEYVCGSGNDTWHNHDSSHECEIWATFLNSIAYQERLTASELDALCENPRNYIFERRF